MTPTGSSIGPCVWWLKMVCPTARRVGPCGVLPGCLSPVPPCSMGWKRGEKKAQGHLGGAFLEWAREAFAGYAAVDELSEGPDGVRSAVANRPCKRVWYEVLDHDPTHDDI